MREQTPLTKFYQARIIDYNEQVHKKAREVFMPKIIENVREQLLDEAKRQITECGYAKTTIRSVSKSCGLAIGTVYNYFPSKDMLIASVMAEDWKLCLQQLEKNASGEPEKIIQGIYDGLFGFMQKYHVLFCDSDAAKVYATMFLNVTSSYGINWQCLYGRFVRKPI